MTEPWGKEKATYMEEYVVMPTGIATQLDGFARGVLLDMVTYKGRNLGSKEAITLKHFHA